jgi:hypothetical protein
MTVNDLKDDLRKHLCDPVAGLTFSADELEQMLRELSLRTDDEMVGEYITPHVGYIVERSPRRAK